MDSVRAYLFGTYWSISTISTVGFGDIRASNNYEKCLTLLMVICGVWFYSQSIGILSTVLISEESIKQEAKYTVIDDLRSIGYDHFDAPRFVESIANSSDQTFK